jgi:hypothetical protein
LTHYNAPQVVTPGTTLDARWRLDEILAVGSMGEVFRGTDLLDGSGCAVKVLRAEFIDDGVQVQRFEREARTTLSLRHPNVVTVHASGVLGDRPWIAMELLEGESLERRLERGALSREDTLAVVRQVAAALDDAHAAGSSTATSSPTTCLCSRPRAPAGQGAGFRLRQGPDRCSMPTACAPRLTPSSARRSTWPRAGPLVARRRPRADLWSLGVMPTSCSGRGALRQAQAADLFVEILTRPHRRRRVSVRPEMPATLDALGGPALEPRPRGGISHRGSLAAGLANALQGKGAVSAPAAAVAPRRWRLVVGRRPTGALALAAVLLR